VLLVKLSFVLAAALFTQGCVGIVTRGMETRKFEPPMVAALSATYNVGSSTEAWGEPRVESPTSMWIKDHWGQPAHIRVSNSPSQQELWTYRFERKWCGLLAWVVVPIPLVLPLGQERVVFQVEDGRVIKAEVTTLGGYEAVAGCWGPEGPGLFARADHWR
jgi:hypothetical protein